MQFCFSGVTRCAAAGILSCVVVVSLAGPVATLLAQEVSAGDWPWWRGPQRNGLVQEGTPPTRFGAGENIRWKAKVPGRGHSSPIVIGDQIFLATADESQQTQSVLAYSLGDGRLLWSQEISRGGFPQNNHRKNTEASSTIASDGERLFVTFFHHRQIQLTALGLDGSQQWQRSAGPFNPKKYEYGYAPSPVVYQGFVIVATEWDGESAITAFNRNTGRPAWRTPRPANITFSTPVIANVSGRDQLFLSGSNQVASYDPTNGRPLWVVPGTTAATCGTMIWEGNVVFASGGYPKAETIAVRADGSRQIVWRNQQKCYEQSMIVVDGFVYGLTDKGVLYCWRANDGREMWRERLAGPVSASPVLAGGHIYWANERGSWFVFKPNPEAFELVAENRLGDEVFASPAVVKDEMIVRVAGSEGGIRQEYLICISQD